jgi:hypothetical protein
MNIEERDITKMSDDEIIAEIQALRERRAQARERRVSEKSAEGVKKVKKDSNEITGDLGNIFDDIFADAEGSDT